MIYYSKTERNSSQMVFLIGWTERTTQINDMNIEEIIIKFEQFNPHIDPQTDQTNNKLHPLYA